MEINELKERVDDAVDHEIHRYWELRHIPGSRFFNEGTVAYKKVQRSLALWEKFKESDDYKIYWDQMAGKELTYSPEYTAVLFGSFRKYERQNTAKDKLTIEVDKLQDLVELYIAYYVESKLNSVVYKAYDNRKIVDMRLRAMAECMDDIVKLIRSDVVAADIEQVLNEPDRLAKEILKKCKNLLKEKIKKESKFSGK